MQTLNQTAMSRVLGHNTHKHSLTVFHMTDNKTNDTKIMQVSSDPHALEHKKPHALMLKGTYGHTRPRGKSCM